MNNSVSNQLDENLSEDILNEGSPTCKVKVSKRLDINMNMTPFNPSRFGSQLKDHSDSVCAPKSLKTQGIQEPTKKKYYAVKHKSLMQNVPHLELQSYYSKTGLSSVHPRKMSLQDEIRTLLQKSAQLRKKSLLAKAQKTRPASESEQKPVEEVCCEGELVTFGNNDIHNK
ncbi:unnamed protein product [Moneuplotes crassus]|uniref:Uncharacterized protein n=1 Tax=Euplotes crassus TaxID=5936 RepID=A0AAD1UB39_EUPCR|nr:unnamed protein product [Moneuplotes crassus]